MSQLELSVPGPVQTAADREQEVSPSLALVGYADGPVRAPQRRRRSERGLVSAEWAMAIIAAVAIVGMLVGLLKSEPVKAVVLRVIKTIINGALTQI